MRKKNKGQLLIVRGLPGSGKSTMACQLENYIHLETDFWHINDDGVYEFDVTNLGKYHRYCRVVTREILNRGLNVVVANTCITLNEVKLLLNIAVELGSSVKVVTMTGEYGSTKDIPEHVTLRHKRKWEDTPKEWEDWAIYDCFFPVEENRKRKN